MHIGSCEEENWSPEYGEGLIRRRFEGHRGRSDREDVVPRQSGQLRYPRGTGRPEGHRPGVSREGKSYAFVLVDNGQTDSVIYTYTHTYIYICKIIANVRESRF